MVMVVTIHSAFHPWMFRISPKVAAYRGIAQVPSYRPTYLGLCNMVASHRTFHCLLLTRQPRKTERIYWSQLLIFIDKCAYFGLRRSSSRLLGGCSTGITVRCLALFCNGIRLPCLLHHSLWESRVALLCCVLTTHEVVFRFLHNDPRFLCPDFNDLQYACIKSVYCPII